MDHDQLIASLAAGGTSNNGIYLYDVDTEDRGPYIDWSTRRTNGVQFEVGDGDGGEAQLELTWDQFADLHRRMTITLLTRSQS